MSTPIPLEPARAYRRSAIEAAACLYRYHKLYVEGVEDQGDEARRGIAFHSAAELYIAKLAALGETMDAELAREAFLDAVEQTLLPAHLIPETEWLFSRWAERFELDRDAYLHVERTIYSTRWGGRFSWRPDLVYAREWGLEIWDWKTHYVAWTPREARDEFQSRMYLLFARDAWPNQPRYVMRYVFTRLNKTVEVSYTPTEIDEIERQVAAAYQVVCEADRTQVYPATPGPQCSFCRLDCPINGTAGRMPIRVDTREAFHALAAEHLALAQRLKLQAKALRTYCVTEGPQVVHGMQFALWPVESARYPVDAVQALADDRGVVLPELTVSKTELGAVVEQPRLKADLAALARTRTTYQFRARKATGHDHAADAPPEEA